MHACVTKLNELIYWMFGKCMAFSIFIIYISDMLLNEIADRNLVVRDLDINA